ncbi:dTDP-glucose 4,6-dehydratase [Methanosarcina sp. WH1]|uniref:dTDP-glucose 4,6-dehydratase n=1 Tax=Methanosarcina sp. WH1 TaxID=1434102 RepID=UPI0009E3C38F|nr:dTDP-glucose 4,6-dehydratase [Methanosarcina sp. WH1]
MVTVLVTGGAGFIGSNFIRIMLDRHKNYRIINLDQLTYAGNLENLRDIETNANYSFVRGNICDRLLVERIVSENNIDYIVNFAAESHVDRSIKDPEIFIKSNVLGTQVLLDAAKKYNINKFLQISTDEVYGSLGNTGYFTENTPLSPNSPYSASKASADLLVRAYYKTFGLKVNITRCSNNYGPYQFPEKLIPLMIYNAINGKKIPVYGDGLNIRDWLHVNDHCSAIDSVLQNGKIGEVYNIGGNNEKTNIDIVKTIIKILSEKLPERDISESLISFIEDRKGHDRRYAIDATKIDQELGWKPQIDFEDGIRMTVDWYLNNKNWLNSIINEDYRNYYQKVYGGL